MSNSTDLVKAFMDVRQNLNAIVKIIAEDDSTEFQMKEMILQFYARQRGHSRAIMETFSLSDVGRLSKDEGEIYFKLSFENYLKGYYKITKWHPIKVRASFVNEKIRFGVLFNYQFDIFIFQNSDSLVNTYVPTLVGNHQINVWSRPLDVPLDLTWYWMNKVYGEPKFSLRSTEGNFLTYNTGEYPTDLFRFFSLAGKQAYENLREQGILTEETYGIIKGRLSWHHADNSDQKPPVPKTDDPNYPEQLVDLRIGDREKLLKIGNSRRPHSSRAWCEWLGFKSTGGSEPFIDRMEKAGLITVENTPDGTYLRLTDRARFILRVA